MFNYLFGLYWILLSFTTLTCIWMFLPVVIRWETPNKCFILDTFSWVMTKIQDLQINHISPIEVGWIVRKCALSAKVYAKNHNTGSGTSYIFFLSNMLFVFCIDYAQLYYIHIIVGYRSVIWALIGRKE